MSSTPALASKFFSLSLVLLTSSWTISVRQTSTVKLMPPAESMTTPPVCFLAAAAAAAFGMEMEEGHHQTMALSPMPKLRRPSRVWVSEEAVDRSMTRKFLCGTGSGRLPCSPETVFRTKIHERRGAVSRICLDGKQPVHEFGRVLCIVVLQVGGSIMNHAFDPWRRPCRRTADTTKPKLNLCLPVRK